MQIDKLQIELRPRSHAQALDLGFALLRSHAGAAYKSFLALWLPLIALCAGLILLFPALDWLWIITARWLRPLLERAPLYVLSRKVFGTTVTWQEAVRAWPTQLRGGALRLLTWGRPFAFGRGLMQPVWQLEMARGDVARMRQRVMSANGTGQAAFWFGVVFFLLELIIAVGLAFFLTMFMAEDGSVNPFVRIFGDDPNDVAPVIDGLVWLSFYAISVSIMAPIYTACCFTLYLNRRASLEAWDLEMQLRQIRRPATVKAHPNAAHAAHALSMLLAATLLAFGLAGAPDASAVAAIPAKATCDGPELEPRKRSADANAHQAQARKLVDQVYRHKDLRGFECVESWYPKPSKKKDKKKDPSNSRFPDLGFVASLFKVLFIALLVGAVGYLVYRYRDRFPAFGRSAAMVRATEVAGLDIRAESLPPDVTAQVRELWARGERRAALALLYRATLSRLVSDDGLQLRQGDTEGDCLRSAGRALQALRLSQGRLDVATAATTLWLNGAYGDRWPGTAAVQARCDEWDAQFGAARERRA